MSDDKLGALREYAEARRLDAEALSALLSELEGEALFPDPMWDDTPAAAKVSRYLERLRLQFGPDTAMPAL